MPSVCRYFLNGNCRYGDFCRNSHNIQNECAPVTSINQGDSNNNNSTETNEVSRNWIDAPEFIPRYISQSTNQQTDEDQGATRWVNDLALKSLLDNILRFTESILSTITIFICNEQKKTARIQPSPMLKSYRVIHTVATVSKCSMIHTIYHRNTWHPHFVHTFNLQSRNQMVLLVVNMVNVAHINTVISAIYADYFVFIPPIRINAKHMKRYALF